MSFKIAVIALTAFIGAQAQTAFNIATVSCSQTTQRLDSYCESVMPNVNACCASVFTIQRNAANAVIRNTTTPSFVCLPVDVAGKNPAGSFITVYNNTATGFYTQYQASCFNTNRTESSSCSGASDSSCSGDSVCCATETLTATIFNTSIGYNFGTGSSNVCVAKSLAATNTSNTSMSISASYSCQVKETTTEDNEEEDSFASLVKLSFALLAVMGLAFF